MLATLPNSSMPNFAHYKKAFIALAIYFIFWIVAPLFLAQSVALDVSEGVNWGREWQMGYFKHPPLSSWVLYSVYRLAGDIGVNFLTQLCSFSGAYFAYRLGGEVMSKQRALLGSLLLFFISYYSYPSLEFNHNVAQLPLWTGLAWAFHLATSTQAGHDKWRYWLIVGVLGGLGMLTKYHVAFLLMTMAGYLFLPSQRHWLTTAKPWVALVIMVGLFLPHLNWLIHNHWLPFDYLHSRIDSDSAWQGHLSWLEFLGLQLASILPLLVVLKRALKLPIKNFLLQSWQAVHFFPITLKTAPQISEQPSLYAHANIKTNDSAITPANRLYLQFMLVIPLLIVVLCSLLGGMMLVNLWAMPMWGLLGLVAVTAITEQRLIQITPRLLTALIYWLIFATLVKVVMMVVLVRFDQRPSRINFPQQAIAQQVATTWQKVSHCPLDSLSGDRWITAIASMRQPQLLGTFPSLMIAGNPEFSPWMTQQRLREHGTMVLWEQDNPVTLPLLSLYDAKILPQPFADSNFVLTQGTWAFAWRDIPNKPPLQIGWATYVPKSCAN